MQLKDEESEERESRDIRQHHLDLQTAVNHRQSTKFAVFYSRLQAPLDVCKCDFKAEWAAITVCYVWVHDSESKKPVWVFPVCNNPVDGKMGIRMCNRGFSLSGWKHLDNHTGVRSCIRRPLLRHLHLGDKLLKEVWARKNDALYKKRKVRASLGIFDGRWSFCNYVHVANKAQ